MRNIIHFAVIFTFTLGIIAPACGFAWNQKQKGSFIEICTAQGIEKRFIASNNSSENTPQENPSPHKSKNKCSFCLASHNLQALIPTNISIELLYAHRIKQSFVQYEVILLSKDTSHEEPRGPPFFV